MLFPLAVDVVHIIFIEFTHLHQQHCELPLTLAVSSLSALVKYRGEFSALEIM